MSGAAHDGEIRYVTAARRESPTDTPCTQP